MALRLTASEMRRARAWAQLLGPAGGAGVAEVASGLVGVQAQDLTAAGLCIRARTSGLTAADVRGAAGDGGPVVLTWSLRGTRHLHRRDDVIWLLGLVGPVFGRPGRRADQLGLGGRTGDRAVAALRRAVATAGALTRSEVKDRLAAVGVDPSGQAAIHVVRRAALEGVLCVVAGPDGQERFAALDPGGPVDPDQAAAELARRYLAAYGPATAGDLAAWSGLPATTVRRAWAAVADEMTAVEGPGGAAWMLTARSEAVAKAAGQPLGVRLTGAFDPLWLGHADRTLLMAPEDRPRVNRGGGMVKPLAVGDGAVVGTWGSRRAGARHIVEVDPFRRLTRSESASVAAEVADIGRFLGTSPELVLPAP